MLAMNEVTKAFAGPDGTVRAIEGITLSVEPGELAAVLGPSGSGKSTLLFIAGALLRPTQGDVLLSDVDPYSLDAGERSAFRARNIGFIFQRFHLLKYLNARQNLLVANTACPQDGYEERADELLRQFGMDHRARHLPSELSVGEQQRTALARAMLNQPKLLLADEPTGNLDRENAAVVLGALRNYAGSSNAVVLVTHDPWATECADRVLELRDGRLQE